MLRHIEKHPQTCVDGRYHPNVVGYCWFNQHRGYLTSNLIDQHQCVAKSCKFLQKYNNKYWDNFNKIQENKKNNKMKRKKISEKAKMIERRLNQITENSRNFKLLRVEKNKSGGFRIYYISTGNINLQELKNIIKKEITASATWHQVQMSNFDKEKVLGYISKEDIIKFTGLLKYINDNRIELSLSDECGCINCGQIFTPSEITHYKKDMFGTAICPYCHKPTIMPESDRYELNQEFLSTMKKFWENQEQVIL